jgi:serine/threonine protein kinase
MTFDTNFKFEVIVNKYLLIKKIGSGKHSQIYISYDIKSKNDFYAFKIYNCDEDAEEQNDDEINNIKKLEKLGITGVIKIINNFKFKFEEDEYFGLVYPIMAGSLYDIIEKQSTFSVDAVRKITLNLLITLKKLHDKAKCVHMDIKPENILLCGDSELLKTIKNSIKKPFRQLFKQFGQKKAVQEFCKYFDDFKNDTESDDYDSDDDCVNKKILVDMKQVHDPTICLADFGTCCEIKDRSENHNMTVYYRTPEDILDYKLLNLSTDLWAVVTSVYELLTGEILFKIDDNDYNIHNESPHSQLLHKIQTVIGPPSEKYLENCENKMYFYKHDGRLKGWKFNNNDVKPISERLLKYNISKEDALLIDDFCMSILKWEVEERSNINKLLLHPFLVKNSQKPGCL